VGEQISVNKKRTESNNMTKIYDDGTDIFQVLDAIKKRAGLFILKNHLDYLYNFISGYKVLADATKTEIKNLDRFEQFPSYLKTELNEDYDNTMGWFGYLHNKYGNEIGFHKFFEFLDKFKDRNDFK